MRNRSKRRPTHWSGWLDEITIRLRFQEMRQRRTKRYNESISNERQSKGDKVTQESVVALLERAAHDKNFRDATADGFLCRLARRCGIRIRVPSRRERVTRHPHRHGTRGARRIGDRQNVLRHHRLLSHETHLLRYHRLLPLTQ